MLRASKYMALTACLGGILSVLLLVLATHDRTCVSTTSEVSREGGLLHGACSGTVFSLPLAIASGAILICTALLVARQFSHRGRR